MHSLRRRDLVDRADFSHQCPLSRWHVLVGGRCVAAGFSFGQPAATRFAGRASRRLVWDGDDSVFGARWLALWLAMADSKFLLSGGVDCCGRSMAGLSHEFLLAHRP